MSGESSEWVRREDVEAYARDGVVCLRRVFDVGWIEALKDAFERAKAAPGPEAIDHAPEEGEGRFLTDLFLWRRDPAVERFIVESPVGEVAARIMSSRAARLLFDTMWIKEPGVVKPTGWHQDQPYYPVDGDQMCAVWLPLDPVAETVTLDFVRGSHRWGRWFEATRTTDGTRWAKETVFEPVPDVDGAPPGTFDRLRFGMEPGDCVVFHGLTLHGAPGNPQSMRRRALSVVCVGDDAVVSKRPATRPNFADVALVPGEPFRGTLFPRLWPRSGGESRA